MTFKFGERVLVKAQIKRHKDGDKATWVRTEYPKPQEAIFLIKRTLQNGEYGYESLGGGDFGWAPQNIEFIPGAWICKPGRNPEKVFLSDLEPILTEYSPLAKEVADIVVIKLIEAKL